MGAVQKADVTDFTLLEPLGPMKRALLEVQEGETVNTTNEITLDAEEYRVDTIHSVRAHVFATGLPQEYSYENNVLTKVTGNDSRDVIEILFTSV